MIDRYGTRLNLRGLRTKVGFILTVNSQFLMIGLVVVLPYLYAVHQSQWWWNSQPLLVWVVSTFPACSQQGLSLCYCCPCYEHNPVTQLCMTWLAIGAQGLGIPWWCVIWSVLCHLRPLRAMSPQCLAIAWHWTCFIDSFAFAVCAGESHVDLCVCLDVDDVSASRLVV